MTQKTCFVIIGYGIKTDYSTGREIDLDKTYKNIIEPVFKQLGFLCFRGCDIPQSGIIDVPMYENILKADFVVADLTTLNPNVLYELGIRHAVKKNTTIVISDKQLKYPFDLSHILIEGYDHLGKGIDYDEVLRFQKKLKEKVKELMAHPKDDSPLYTFLPNLNTPSFSDIKIKDTAKHTEVTQSISIKLYESGKTGIGNELYQENSKNDSFSDIEISNIIENKESDQSISKLLNEAETAKNNSDFPKAIVLLEKAKKLTPANQFILQRLALSTYKAKKPNAIKALEKAEKILSELNPEQTTDIETLGLSGAINKRLYEETKNEEYLEKALWFYERGFYIGNDYYNGINTAYLYTIMAPLATNRYESYAKFGNGNIIRKKVIEICNNLTNSKIWQERDDKEWVLLSLAEAYYGLNDMENVKMYINKAKKFHKGPFSLETFLQQQSKLKAAIENFHKKFDHDK